MRASRSSRDLSNAHHDLRAAKNRIYELEAEIKNLRTGWRVEVDERGGARFRSGTDDARTPETQKRIDALRALRHEIATVGSTQRAMEALDAVVELATKSVRT